jgi:hypothetical protein
VTIFRNRLEKGDLPMEIVARLTAIQFPRTALEAYYQWGIALLQKWLATHGPDAIARADVPARIRFFLDNMRRRFLKNQLTQSQVNQLAALGVSWARLDSTDIRMIMRLVAIKKKVGKANVEVMSQQEPDLHDWIECQFEKAARSELPSDFVAELRKVGLEVGDPLILEAPGF